MCLERAVGCFVYAPYIDKMHFMVFSLWDINIDPLAQILLTLGL